MMRTHAARICRCGMHERTNEQYGRTYRSPWDPSLRLSDAHVRVQPEIVAQVGL